MGLPLSQKLHRFDRLHGCLCLGLCLIQGYKAYDIIIYHDKYIELAKNDVREGSPNAT